MSRVNKMCNQRFAESSSASPVVLTSIQKQRKTATTRSLPKRKVFPFLELPAEIRNIIYTYTLTDLSGINFVAVQRNKRRCVERVSQEILGSGPHSHSYYRPNSINANIDNVEDMPASLVPSLLAVNKQIHQEGCHILYGNELVFADTIALYAFMINIGPVSASYIKRMRLKGWGYGPTLKAYNNACFAVLIWATNLQKFCIDTNIGWCRRPKLVAQRLYRDAFPWLEAVGNAKGNFDAALGVLDLSKESLAWQYPSNPSQNTTSEDVLKAFNIELSKNLRLQQKRVMAKPVSKRTSLKVSK